MSYNCYRYQSINDFVESVRHLCFDNMDELKTIVVYFTLYDIRRSNNQNKNNLIIKINKFKANDKLIENFDELNGLL